MSGDASALGGRVEAIARAIGKRKLIWFGTRGEDGHSLLPLAGLLSGFEYYSLTAPLTIASIDEGFCLESFTHARVDLDTYDLDLDQSVGTRHLRQALLASLRQPAVLVPYRSSTFVSALRFANLDTLKLLGMFHERQAAFDHKPWVETSLNSLGVATIPWRYVADEDRRQVLRQLEREPLMIRASRTSGGVGIDLLTDPDDLERLWPRQREAFVAVGPYLGSALPANVSGCAFPDGTTSVHPLSLQIIGVPSCTSRRFGYCGNDFAASREISPKALAAIDEMVQKVGAWLHLEGYVGAFGLDMLIDDDTAWFTELNPRFQGSSSLSAEIAQYCELPDIYLDHVAAHVGVRAPDRITISDWLTIQPQVAQVTCHNIYDGDVGTPESVAMLSSGEAIGQLEMLPATDVTIDEYAALGRIVFSEQVTDSGFGLSPRAHALVGELTSLFSPTKSNSSIDRCHSIVPAKEIDRV